ncbi:hypothetical protein O181_003777 [Austropuccinia psidii MF-1]|uniref:Integrase catalytic domain-containing protein n=1 Tax=Austropuccinia psidii MF-1 TaxID=1389203 RepID=A0A9Q3BF00_9BASI|nr:hypothetical protein [Austropuccinia psidii MF-1]
MVAIPAAVIDHGASVSAVNYYPLGKTYCQPVSTHNHVYQAPQPSGSPSLSQIPCQMVKKAGSFCGLGQSKSLIDQYGSACLYFRKGQHWYADCKAQLWTDNAGEYSGKLGKELEGCRTLWLPTETYLPDHNGKAERLNRTIGDMARIMLNASGLPSPFWSDTYSCATHVRNCLPNKRVAPLTPRERLFGTEPCPSQLYPFGSSAFVHVLSEKQGKLDPRETECILLTFSKSGKRWIFLNIPSKRIFNSTLAMFPDYQNLPVVTSKSKGDVSFIINSLRLGEVPTNEIFQEKEKAIRSLPTHHDMVIPRKINQAFKLPFSAQWREVVEVDLGQFEKQNVWEPVFPCPKMHVLGAKWVFDVKWKACREIERFKASHWHTQRRKPFSLCGWTQAGEYAALVDGTQLLACLCTLLEPLVGHLPLSINCENKAAILIAEDNLSKKQTKYFDRAFYFVNDFVRQFNVKLNWTPTINQSSNVLTKVLGSVKIEKARGALSFINWV